MICGMSFEVLELKNEERASVAESEEGASLLGFTSEPVERHPWGVSPLPLLQSPCRVIQGSIGL